MARYLALHNQMHVFIYLGCTYLCVAAWMLEYLVKKTANNAQTDSITWSDFVVMIVHKLTDQHLPQSSKDKSLLVAHCL